MGMGVKKEIVKIEEPKEQEQKAKVSLEHSITVTQAEE